MKVSRVCNLTLLRYIADAETITIDELKKAYLPPEQRGIIQGSTVTFDNDLKVLELEGYITLDGNVVKSINR